MNFKITITYKGKSIIKDVKANNEFSAKCKVMSVYNGECEIIKVEKEY